MAASKIGSPHLSSRRGQQHMNGFASTALIRRSWRSYVLFLFISIFFLSLSCHLHPNITQIIRSSHETQDVCYHCYGALPQILADAPPHPKHPLLLSASSNLQRELDNFISKSDLDSVCLAVTTSSASVFQLCRGARRANETDPSKRGNVHQHSIYRIASISKLFTAVETFILRQRGVLNLDDDVAKHIPSFKRIPPTKSSTDTPITIRQLLTHMSGLGRDWPPGNASGHWPSSLQGEGPPVINGLPFPDHDAFFQGIENNAPVTVPYHYPIYSNIGFSLLGLTNVAANRAVEGDENSPDSHASLLERDMFMPLGLNDSTFLITDEYEDRAVVASIESEETYQDFMDASNPSGGQMSSLSDFLRLMRTFLNPNLPNALLPSSVMREWLRPLHFWWDDATAVGMLWEIFKTKMLPSKPLMVYQKLGELAGHHAAFSIVPSHSFGIAVLSTGPTSHTEELVQINLKHFLPAFEAILMQELRELYCGEWSSSTTFIRIEIMHGGLYLSRYLVDGVSFLTTMQHKSPDSAAEPSPLWSTINEEFHVVNPGCTAAYLTQWINLNMLGYIDGAPVNLIKFVPENEGGRDLQRKLEIPALKRTLYRSKKL